MRKLFIGVVAAFIALAASAQELNVGTINVRTGRPLRPSETPTKGDYKRANGWDQRKSYLFDMIKLEAFDVFGAQEVKKEALDDLVAALPDYSYVGVARDDGAAKGEFCPVFYQRKKFKLLDGGTFWISETPNEVSKGWDGACRRICSWAFLERKSDKSRFYFLCIHLDHKGKVAKLEGSKLIVDWVKEHCKGESVIVVGDYNVTQMSDSYKVFAESGVLKDCYDAAKYRFAPTGTLNVFNPRRYSDMRIDHIFLSKDIEVSRYGILTYHYYRDMDADVVDMGSAAPVEIKGENRDVKCPTDHYPVQAFITLPNANTSKKSKK